MSYIILETNGSNTRIDLDENQNPIWNGISEPTLSLLQAAYLEQQSNIEIHEDVILPITEINYMGFRLGMISSNSYNQLILNADSLGRLSNQRLEGALLIETVNWNLVAQLWNSLKDNSTYQLTTEDAANFTTIASQNNVPLTWDSLGNCSAI